MCQTFGVIIGNAKTAKKVQFRAEAPVLKCYQKSYNSCCLSSLVSAFQFICDDGDINALVNLIK